MVESICGKKKAVITRGVSRAAAPLPPPIAENFLKISQPPPFPEIPAAGAAP